MQNITISMANRPGSLAAVTGALGACGISIEGGGMFTAGEEGLANFLVADGEAARMALEGKGFEVMRVDDVVLQRLKQDEAGQLGKLLRKMAEANVNVMTQYSDHDHQLVLVVDNLPAAKAVSDAWMQERSARAKLPVPLRVHRYELNVRWTGNKGLGTSAYKAYDRSHDITAAGKAVIEGSSDPAFRGDSTRWNPEDLLVSSAAACHMLTYLHLCANRGVVVVSYEDRATGVMEEHVGGKGAFVRIELHPTVVIDPAGDAQLAHSLHEEAHRVCFIANSLAVPVVTLPEVVV